jgi:hypothetical protein
MRRVIFLVACLIYCAACAASPRYQLQQTKAGLQETVTSAEQSYQALYRENKAGRVTASSMILIDTLYESWRKTQQLLVDAVRAGAIKMKE